MGLITGLVAVGVGLAGVGALTQVEAARRAEQHQKAIIEAEMRAEERRRRAMELEARRRSLEILRVQQRARSTALAVATNQGMAYGSALPGAYGQISGQSGVNMLGVSQNLQLGQQMFDINAGISQNRIGMASAQSQMMTGGALSSLGGTLISVMPQISRLSGGFNLGSIFGPPASTSASVGNPLRLGSLY